MSLNASPPAINLVFLSLSLLGVPRGCGGGMHPLALGTWVGGTGGTGDMGHGQDMAWRSLSEENDGAIFGIFSLLGFLSLDFTRLGV